MFVYLSAFEVCKMFFWFLGLVIFFAQQKLSRERKYFFYDKLVQVYRNFLSLMSKDVIYLLACFL